MVESYAFANCNNDTVCENLVRARMEPLVVAFIQVDLIPSWFDMSNASVIITNDQQWRLIMESVSNSSIYSTAINDRLMYNYALYAWVEHLRMIQDLYVFRFFLTFYFLIFLLMCV